MTDWNHRQGKLFAAVHELSGDEARHILGKLIGHIRNDEAGNTQDPFAWLPTKDFRKIEGMILNEQSDEPS